MAALAVKVSRPQVRHSQDGGGVVGFGGDALERTRQQRFPTGESPFFVDSRASDADAIGIYPVHWQWTEVDWEGRDADFI
jgi:hypothetical protein